MSRALIAVFDRGDEVSNPLSPLYPLMHAAPPLKEGNPPASECHFSDCALDMGESHPQAAGKIRTHNGIPTVNFCQICTVQKDFLPTAKY